MGGHLNLDGGTRLPYNLSTALCLSTSKQSTFFFLKLKNGDANAFLGLVFPKLVSRALLQTKLFLKASVKRHRESFGFGNDWIPPEVAK